MSTEKHSTLNLSVDALSKWHEPDYFRNRFQNANKTVIFYRKDNIFSLEKNQLQIVNSGFVKTCDEHVHNCSGSNGNIFAAAKNDIHKTTHKSWVESILQGKHQLIQVNCWL